MEIEKQQRLSRSILWKLLFDAYAEFGIQAWSEKGVPSYLTSNPFTARQYAQVILGFIRDCERNKKLFDKDHPLYILDLGAGTGRFGYLFLKSLNKLLALLRHIKVPIRYVMTDIAGGNIEFWKSHPYLQPFIKEGMLDFAYFSHDQTTPIELLLTKETISAETVKNPLILIANYFFDTLPQDLFKFQGGKLLEGRVTLSTAEVKIVNPLILNEVETFFDYHPIESIDNYYHDLKEVTPILKSYGNELENIPFFFPEGAFRTLRYFRTITKDRLFLLAADQGSATEKQLQGFEPYISKHGTFSMPVNYHALARYFRSLGGSALLTPQPQPSFVIAAMVLGASFEDIEETRCAFETHIARFEPNDYFLLLDYTENEWLKPSLEALILLLKFGDWDPINCHQLLAKIRYAILHATPEAKELLANAIEEVWNQFYPCDKNEAAFVSNLGLILYEIGKINEAKVYFQRAVEIDGDNPLYRMNLLNAKQLLSQAKEVK